MDLPVMPPVKPMLAKPVPLDKALGMLPDIQLEPKWDGFRAIVFRDGDQVHIGSRTGKPMERYFPDVVESVRAALPERCVVDGEIVIARSGDDDGARSHLDFELLSQRIHPARSRVQMLAETTPAAFVVFDVLALGDDSCLDLPLARRMDLLDGVELRGPRVFATPRTQDADLAARWFETFEGAGLDGLVAKPVDAAYQPGKRSMLKVKHARTADVVLAGYRLHKTSTPERPLLGSLLLGLYGPGPHTLQFVGVAASFTEQRRAELVQELAPLVVTPGTSDADAHPWSGQQDPAKADPVRADGMNVDPAESDRAGNDRARNDRNHPARRGTADARPGAGDRLPGAESRWSGGKDLSFTPLRPERVLEVGYDHMEGTRFRHTTQFKRWRPDRDPASCTYEQLADPVEFDLAELLPGAPGTRQ